MRHGDTQVGELDAKAWAGHVATVLKACPCCGRELTTHNTRLLGDMDGMLWFNCLGCESTAVLPSKNKNGTPKRAV